MSPPGNQKPLDLPGAPNSVTRALAQILGEASGMRKLPALTVLGSGGVEEIWTQLRFCRQEGMLRDLQKSVEEEEQVWKAKLTASEEELQKVSAWGTPGFVACVQKAGVGYKSDGDLHCSCQP